MKMSIVIPCYNEEENLERLASVLKKMEKYKELEFILVNNGSTDDSEEILQKIKASSNNIRLAKVDVNKGYGFGIKQGLKEANGIYGGWLHADMQISPYEVIRAYKFLERSNWSENYFIKGFRSKDNRSLSERLFTSVMGIMATIILKRKKVDTNGIPVIIPMQFYNSLDNIPDNVLIELYIYDAAQRDGLVEKRMKVKYGNREYGETKLLPDLSSRVRTIRNTVGYMFKLRRTSR